MKKPAFIETAIDVLTIESSAINAQISRLDNTFTDACQLILQCSGRVIVTGMGKSGHIAGKIAATLASTGTPAFFVHPGEASHGDLGMITPKDLVIAVSNSGETPEVLTILPILKRLGIPLIGIAGKITSTLAKTATVFLHTPVEQEACPMNLAPTTSTTLTLAMGDALAMAVLNAREFTEQDFALSHPGGSLGKRLLLYVSDIMHTENAIPKVLESETIAGALLEMSSKGLGMTAIVNNNDELLGIFTDGDLRRTLAAETDLKSRIDEVMTKKPITVASTILAAELVSVMEQQRINAVFVTNQDNQVLGALNMLDLLKAGVV